MRELNKARQKIADRDAELARMAGLVRDVHKQQSNEGPAATDKAPREFGNEDGIPSWSKYSP
jgi:hypothetical protein